MLTFPLQRVVLTPIFLDFKLNLENCKFRDIQLNLPLITRSCVAICVQLKQENNTLKDKVDTLRGGKDAGRAPDATATVAAEGGVAGWGCLKVILDKFKYVDYKDRPHLYHHFG